MKCIETKRTKYMIIKYIQTRQNTLFTNQDRSNQKLTYKQPRQFRPVNTLLTNQGRSDL